MEKATIGVDGMMCDHCVKAVSGAVSALPGVNKESVAVDLKEGTVKVEHDPELSPLARIKEEIEEQGYQLRF